ncbi:hypothetical protein [Cryobacterium sp. Y82]|uniref:hypothetical protein n=1 Tax=Cryobacterium sp. Y82 TaxID=2045017 RepID=UPI0011B0E154|nr:hypothetical protein [Cryobacterium sp. Y82]
MTAAVAIVALLAGCSSSVADREAAPQPNKARELAEVVHTGAVTIADAASSPSGKVKGLTTSDGYTFDALISIGSAAPTTSVTNAKPGTTDLTWSAPITKVLTNTTPSRNAPESQLLHFWLEGYWPEESPVCQLDTDWFLGPTKPKVWAFEGTNYCTITTIFSDGFSGEFISGTPVSGTSSLDLTFNIGEDAAPGVVADLTNGPATWVLGLYGPAEKSPCLTDYTYGTTSHRPVFWVSNPNLGCVPPNTGTGVTTLDQQTIDAAATVTSSAAAAVQKSTDALNIGISTCPFAVESADLYGGLTTTSYQSLKWNALYGFQKTGKKDLTWPSFECRDGAMRVIAYVPDGQVDVESYLVNRDGSFQWPDMSDAASMHNGKAVVTTRTVTPEGGDAYSVAQVAWYTNGLVIEAVLVAATPETGMQWLNTNIPAIVTNLSAWTGSITES